MSQKLTPEEDRAFQEVAEALTTALYLDRVAGLEQRICTKQAPMPMPDKDKFRWSHPDATFSHEFFNLDVYYCRNCTLMFSAKPRPGSRKAQA